MPTKLPNMPMSQKRMARETHSALCDLVNALDQQDAKAIEKAMRKARYALMCWRKTKRTMKQLTQGT